jgi:hypothetical protein
MKLASKSWSSAFAQPRNAPPRNPLTLEMAVETDPSFGGAVLGLVALVVLIVAFACGSVF